MHMGRTLCTQGTHKKDNTHGDIFPGYDAHFLYTIMEVPGYSGCVGRMRELQ